MEKILKSDFKESLLQSKKDVSSKLKLLDFEQKQSFKLFSVEQNDLKSEVLKSQNQNYVHASELKNLMTRNMNKIKANKNFQGAQIVDFSQRQEHLVDDLRNLIGHHEKETKRSLQNYSTEFEKILDGCKLRFSNEVKTFLENPLDDSFKLANTDFKDFLVKNFSKIFKNEEIQLNEQMEQLQQLTCDVKGYFESMINRESCQHEELVHVCEVTAKEELQIFLEKVETMLNEIEKKQQTALEKWSTLYRYLLLAKIKLLTQLVAL